MLPGRCPLEVGRERPDMQRRCGYHRRGRLADLERLLFLQAFDPFGLKGALKDTVEGLMDRIWKGETRKGNTTLRPFRDS